MYILLSLELDSIMMYLDPLGLFNKWSSNAVQYELLRVLRMVWSH